MTLSTSQPDSRGNFTLTNTFDLSGSHCLTGYIGYVTNTATNVVTQITRTGMMTGGQGFIGIFATATTGTYSIYVVDNGFVFPTTTMLWPAKTNSVTVTKI